VSRACRVRVTGGSQAGRMRVTGKLQTCRGRGRERAAGGSRAGHNSI
jgi:hypothetical protein